MVGWLAGWLSAQPPNSRRAYRTTSPRTTDSAERITTLTRALCRVVLVHLPESLLVSLQHLRDRVEAPGQLCKPSGTRHQPTAHAQHESANASPTQHQRRSRPGTPSAHSPKASPHFATRTRKRTAARFRFKAMHRTGNRLPRTCPAAFRGLPLSREASPAGWLPSSSTASMTSQPSAAPTAAARSTLLWCCGGMAGESVAPHRQPRRSQRPGRAWLGLRNTLVSHTCILVQAR